MAQKRIKVKHFPAFLQNFPWDSCSQGSYSISFPSNLHDFGGSSCIFAQTLSATPRPICSKKARRNQRTSLFPLGTFPAGYFISNSLQSRG
jgi:hypothetical protein